MMAQSEGLPLPDFEEAERFLTALDETAEAFTFQSFDDDKARKDRHMAVILSGPFERHRDNLARFNSHGAGIFVTVNETDGRGRKLENIQRIRAIWHEDDHGQARDFPLQPHITVESSPGKYHRYWLVDGLSLEQFRGVMNTLVRAHGSDPNAKDPARVLRLPGFLHLKDAAHPWRVRLADVSGELPYSAEQIVAAFPPSEPATNRVDTPADFVALPPDQGKSLAAQLAAMAARHTHENPTMGRHAQILWLGRECGQRGVPLELMDFALGQFETLMRPCDTTGQPAPMHWESSRKAFADAHTKGAGDPPEKRYQPKTYRPPNPPRPAASVESITEENAERLRIEQQIREADGDFGELIYTIAPAVLHSGLREATKAHLLKQIREATGVSMTALKADGPKQPKDPGGDDREKPANFMAELNQRHAVVPVGGRVLILNKEYDPGLRRSLLTFSSRTDFVTRYENRSVRKSGEEIDIGTYWLKDRNRHQCEGLAFMPGGDVPGYYNLWTGWGIQPHPGSCDRFVDFVGEVICGGSSALFAYTWGWMAHLFQRPQELPGTALVLRGAQGIGKNRFAEALGRLVGAHFIQLSSLNQVTGRFSGHLADALLVFANEAIWGGDKTAEGALKAMITDPYSAIEAKGKDIRTVVNYKRLIAASNEDWIVPRGRGDRRFVILDVSDRYKENRDYFGQIQAELKAGGYRALMHELMAAPLGEFNPANIPDEIRNNGWDLALRSASSVERWWYDILQRGYLYHEETSYGDDQHADSGYLWPDLLASERVQNLYLKWCERHRVPHPESIETLGAVLIQLGLKRIRPRAGGKRVWSYGFPDLVGAREIFGARFRIPPDEWERFADEGGDG